MRDRPEGLDAQATIGNDVLQRLVGVVPGHRAILVVVMLFFLPVQQGMGSFFRRREGRGLARDGSDLPERGDDEKNEDEPTAHRSSLARALASRSPWIRIPHLLPLGMRVSWRFESKSDVDRSSIWGHRQFEASTQAN